MIQGSMVDSVVDNLVSYISESKSTTEVLFLLAQRLKGNRYGFRKAIDIHCSCEDVELELQRHLEGISQEQFANGDFALVATNPRIPTLARSYSLYEKIKKEVSD